MNIVVTVTIEDFESDVDKQAVVDAVKDAIDEKFKYNAVDIEAEWYD